MPADVQLVRDDAEYQASRDILGAGVGGETVLLDLAKGTYFSLNRTGTVLWETLSLPHTRRGLVDRLAASVSDAPDADAMDADVDGFLQSMLEHGLVVRLGSDGSEEMG